MKLNGFDYSILRGKIVEKYKTQKLFAKELGISERSLSLKLNNRIYFTQDEILKCIKLLNEPLEKIVPLFFCKLSSIILNLKGDYLMNERLLFKDYLDCIFTSQQQKYWLYVQKRASRNNNFRKALKR